MRTVPRNRARQKSKAIGFIDHIIPFHALDVPSPDAVVMRDEVDRQPEVMRTLPSAGFCGPFGQKVQLPLGAAVSLEDIEKGLRDAGLIVGSQRLRQSKDDSRHFRVERLCASLDGMYAVRHDISPVHDAGPKRVRIKSRTTQGEGNALTHSAVETGAETDTKACPGIAPTVHIWKKGP